MSLVELFGWAWALAPVLREEEAKFGLDADSQTVECLRCGACFEIDEIEEVEAHDCE